MSTSKLTRRKVLQSLMAVGASPIALAGAGISVNVNAKQNGVRIATLCARWWCSLSKWEWPEDWGKPPAEFVRVQSLKGRDRHLACGRLGYNKVMHALETAAGRKECLRVWNVENRQDMTNKQFEEWWSDRSLLSTEEFYEKYYVQRSNQ